jgi:multiple sugar transport system permease protein
MSSISETRRTRPQHRNETRTAILFLLPFLLFYGLFLLWPIVLQFIDSFRSTGLNSAAGSHFIGLDNYRELFSDSAFWWAVWHTIWFTILTTVPLVILGLVLAVLANRKLPGRWFFRTAFFAPYVLPSAVVALIWIWIFQPSFGLLNGWISDLGGSGDINWLGDKTIAMFAISLATVWWTLGFNFLLYLAGLQSIPPTVYDAAAVDGASGFRTFWHVTLPLLRRTHVLVIALQIIASLKLFDQVYIMTNGGPDNATRSSLLYIFQEGFQEWRIGYASALSVIFFLIVVVASSLQLVAFRGGRVEAR